MFILLTLIVMLAILTIFLIVGVAFSGAAFLIIFGDLVIAIAVIMWMIKRSIQKRIRK